MRVLLLAALMMATALAGCAADTSSPTEVEPEYTEPTYNAGQTTKVTDRVSLPFNVTDKWSHVLEAGAYDILPGKSIFIDVELPITEGGSAVIPTDSPIVHLGLFLPAIPGCDWEAATLPEACHVPIIADAGPYYTESDVDAESRNSGRLGEFMISNFVPHGYGVAQISVFGSGKSTHCFDMFGLAEQLGVHGAVEWLGSQPWSNGAVGLMGRSYDGSTPWMAAAHADPAGSALKTIVPISGLSGLGDLVTWNGASEARILLFQNVIYGTFGIGSDPAMEVLRRATCPDWITATPMGAAGYASGNEVVDVEGTYWQERNMMDRVIANYRGSLYMIHGLQDDNVDPHAGWIAHKMMIDGGWETKGLYGQWYHSYPDRPGEHGSASQLPRTSVRYDWAQDLLEWFDYYLKGTGAKPLLHIEVQENTGAWRIDDGLEPSNANMTAIALTGGDVNIAPAGAGPVAGTVSVPLGTFEQDIVLGGLSSVTFTVTPTGPGGQLYVELRDATANRDFGLSYGIMELRHASGNFAPVTPGVPMEVTIPFQYFSDKLPAGNQLEMRISHTGNGYLPSPIVQPVIVHLDSRSVMNLSIVEADPSAYFEPPVWFSDDE